MRAAGSAAAGPAGAKAAPQPKITNQQPSDDDLHEEYAWAWVLHNLVPFADKLLGIAGRALRRNQLQRATRHRRDVGPMIASARSWDSLVHFRTGAMDQRPLSWWDWPLRLPFILWAAFQPKSRTAVTAAHVINIVFWAARMPAVWDYMCWVALTELTYIAAVLWRAEKQLLMRDRFLPAVKALLITLYFSAAFWKLTTGFLDPRVSCAATLVAELSAALFGARVPASSSFARGLLASAPAQIVLIEFLVPTLLLAKHRSAVPVALAFHFLINLMPVTYAGGFSIAMCCRLVLFLPGSLRAAYDKPARPAAVKATMPLALAAVLYIYAHRAAFDTAGLLFLGLGWAYLASVFEEPVEITGAADVKLRRSAVIVGGIGYGFLAPILGIMAMASSTMYGNVRQFDYTGGNHLLVPTGLLQKWCRDSRSMPCSGFGGGMVRLERKGTSGKVFDELYFCADITHEQPPYARQMLAAQNFSGYYFEFYAARNYFDRAKDHSDTALHNAKAGDVAPTAPPLPPPSSIAMPAYELRRALRLARRRGEPFSVRYVPLASSLPSAWAVERPPKKNYVAYAWPSGICRGNCGGDALVHLPRPPLLLLSLLHPYPTPLLGDGDEPHCTT